MIPLSRFVFAGCAVFIAAVLSAMVPAAAQSDVTVSYDITIESALGTTVGQFVVNEDGTGTLVFEDGTVYELSGITVDGNALTYDITFDIEGQQLPATFEGAVEGSDITGEFVTEMGNGTLTGSRTTYILPGVWDLTVESQLGTSLMEFIVSPELNATLNVTDGPSYELGQITQDNDKVTYDITFDIEGQQLPATFEGTIGGDDIAGEFVTDMGNGTVTGTRRGADLPGTWNLTIESQLGTTLADLVINDDMTGNFASDIGNVEISNVNLAGNTLTYDITFDIEGQQLPAVFEGMVIGDEMTGEYITDLGNGIVTGARELASLPGTWKLTIESQLGTTLADFIVNDDMTGRLESDLGDFEATNIELAGNALTYDITFDIDGQPLPAVFEGTIDGDEMTGEYITDLGNGIVDGARQLASLPGTWNLTVESALGTTELAFVVNEDMTGKIMSDLGDVEPSDIQLAGNTLTYDVTFDIEGQQLPARFEGTINGDEMTGEYITDMGNGTVTGIRGATAAAATQVAALAGEWDLTVATEAMDVALELLVNDDLTGEIGYELGKSSIEKITVDGDSVKFDVSFDVQDQDVPASFDGRIDGDNLTGTFTSIMGEGDVTGVRRAHVALVPAKYAFTVESQLGTTDMTLVLAEDNTGTISFELGDVDVTNVQIQGDKLTFDANFFIEGDGLPAHFEGTLEGDQITGTFTSEMGDGTVSGQRIEN